MANFLSDELTIGILPVPTPMLAALEFVFCAAAVAAISIMHIIAMLSAKPSVLPFPMFVLPLVVVCDLVQVGVEKLRGGVSVASSRE
jgi:hypothetical protein